MGVGILVLPMMASIAGSSGCGGNNAAFDPETLPGELKVPYESFAFHCSRCHTLARPLTAHIESNDHWDRYVARMRRMPGSGIGPEDETLILRFLYHYTGEIRGFDTASTTESPNEAPAEARTENESTSGTGE